MGAQALNVVCTSDREKRVLSAKNTWSRIQIPCTHYSPLNEHRVVSRTQRPKGNIKDGRCGGMLFIRSNVSDSSPVSRKQNGGGINASVPTVREREYDPRRRYCKRRASGGVETLLISHYYSNTRSEYEYEF